MIRDAQQWILRGAFVPALASAALCPTPAYAGDGPRLFTPDTLELSADGEPSWLDGGFGKLRSGGDRGGGFRAMPMLGQATLVWQPQLSWSLGATVALSAQGGPDSQAGISEAFLHYRPMRADNLAFSVRAGLMWPPVSLEHEGADWHVADSITPSAINSWIGEEVRPAAAEATFALSPGGRRLTATAAVMAANDTSGTLLTFRGWALHDRTTIAFHRQPLPPLNPTVSGFQAHYTHPLLDIEGGFAKHPGYYAKLGWQPPLPVRFELFRYDNRADPQAKKIEGPEWGWRTDFTHAGAVAQLGQRTTLKAQAIEGRTLMGYSMNGARWIDCRFRSAFVLLSHGFGTVKLATRAEAFATRNAGSFVGDEYDEDGWSAMVAAKRQFGPVTGFVELLHVSSLREDRGDIGLAERQRQTQLQGSLKIRW